MKYKDFETILSAERIERYVLACNGDTRKAMTLYRENLRLSQEMFTLISCFEVALRNAVDKTLTDTIGDDWLRNSILPNGMFMPGQFAQTRQIVNKVYHRLLASNAYTHSKLLSEMLHDRPKCRKHSLCIAAIPTHTDSFLMDECRCKGHALRSGPRTAGL